MPEDNINTPPQTPGEPQNIAPAEAVAAPTPAANIPPAPNAVPPSATIAPQKNPELALIGQEISGCLILEKVSSGGMGTVFKARHKALDRIVCVKILSPALSEDKKAVSLFLTEARAIAEIDHPNIVFVYNVGREKGFYFIVMSFIEGESLSNIVRKKPNLPISFIIDTFMGILRGLEAAHQKGIIHRDIKPSNILINKKLEPKIVDFGIAKKVDKDKGSTKTTELAGTAYFLSPEQALGRAIDTRADLYSLGASLFYVLTGKYPFTGKNSMEIIQKHINEPVPDVSAYRRGVPPWLAAGVAKLMAKNPDERFQTATETLLYLQRRRADDQIAAAGGGVNIADEVGLKINTQDIHESPVIQPSRHDAKPRFSMDLRTRVPASNKTTIPIMELGGADLPQRPRLPSEVMISRRNSMLSRHSNSSSIPPVGGPAVVVGKAARRASVQQNIRRYGLLSALAAVMMVIAGTLFIGLGSICAGYDTAGQPLAKALITPWLGPEFMEGQLFLGCAAFVFLVFAASMLFFEKISKTAPIVLLVCALGYFAGLYGYAPAQIAWGGAALLPIYALVFGALGINIQDSDYYPLYIRIAGAGCFALAFYCAFTFFEPASFTRGEHTQALFYATIGLMAAAMVLPFLRGSIIYRFATLGVFACACAAIWFYQASGDAYTLLSGLNAPAAAEQAAAPQEGNILGDFVTTPAASEQAQIPQNSREEFLRHMRSLQENSTPQEIDRAVWSHALQTPVDNFKQGLKTQGAAHFALIALMVYGVVLFIVSLFERKEEMWNLI